MFCSCYISCSLLFRKNISWNFNQQLIWNLKRQIFWCDGQEWSWVQRKVMKEGRDRLYRVVAYYKTVYYLSWWRQCDNLCSRLLGPLEVSSCLCSRLLGPLEVSSGLGDLFQRQGQDKAKGHTYVAYFQKKQIWLASLNSRGFKFIDRLKHFLKVWCVGGQLRWIWG